ncbi:hypothetical protein DSO57_1010873 [Entomophthora muscae]|uniref:Uncharacterized protein n=1 Tax=Entomophthora muscae TaxID=34485 RepID=A0ACC2TTR3_9FUNG|nr:hypothetical protein DSO57_1010873 [Entomophthora muscae]
MYSALPLQFGSLAVSSPAIVFPYRDFDILIGTQFMRNFGAKIDFQENVLEILGQKLPIYYTLDGIITETKRCNYINIAYQDGIIPVWFYQSGKKISMLPTQIEENKGIPLRAYKTYEIKLGDQHILETKLTLEIPEGLYGEIEQPYQRSRLEPSVCPGIVIPGHKEIQILAANLTTNTIHVKKGQVIAFLHLLPSEEIARFENFGSLADMRLPDTKPPLCPVIPQNTLVGLSTSEKDAIMKLFEKYKSIFAKDNFDLGCAKNVQHYINTGDMPPIQNETHKKIQGSR